MSENDENPPAWDSMFINCCAWKVFYWNDRTYQLHWFISGGVFESLKYCCINAELFNHPQSLFAQLSLLSRPFRFCQEKRMWWITYPVKDDAFINNGLLDVTKKDPDGWDCQGVITMWTIVPTVKSTSSPRAFLINTVFCAFNQHNLCFSS